jgi:hypothetical protein
MLLIESNLAFGRTDVLQLHYQLTIKQSRVITTYNLFYFVAYKFALSISLPPAELSYRLTHS